MCVSTMIAQSLAFKTDLLYPKAERPLSLNSSPGSEVTSSASKFLSAFFSSSSFKHTFYLM